jgi:hypothetical protein
VKFFSVANARQFGFRARLSTTLQFMRLADHVNLNFNNKMSSASASFDRGLKKRRDSKTFFSERGIRLLLVFM